MVEGEPLDKLKQHPFLHSLGTIVSVVLECFEANHGAFSNMSLNALFAHLPS